MSRENTIELLRGIVKYCEAHWMLEDLSDDEVAAEYEDLSRFDTDHMVAYGLIEWFEDIKDCVEDIRPSIDAALEILHAIHPNHKDYLEEA